VITVSIVSYDPSEYQSAITVESNGDVLVVDSRLIALDLDIQHEVLMRTVKKHQVKIEQRFGIIRFENGKINGRGRPEKFAWLTEDQAMFVMTLSRNSDRVMDCKANLVEAFSKARRLIPAQSEKIRELELRLKIAELEKGTSDNQAYLLARSEFIATTQGPQMLALIQGRPDAVVEKVEKVTETIIVRDGRNVSFEGKSTAELARELGYKSGKQLEDFLRKQKRSDLICEGFRAVQAPYIPTTNLSEVKKLWSESRKASGTQLFLGE
jgi:phage regulator Rha-like protein